MSSGQQVLIEPVKMIISGEFEGVRALLKFQPQNYTGVSRQPVRIAFRLLEQEGLLIKLDAWLYRPGNFSKN